MSLFTGLWKYGTTAALTLAVFVGCRHPAAHVHSTSGPASTVDSPLPSSATAAVTSDNLHPVVSLASHQEQPEGIVRPVEPPPVPPETVPAPEPQPIESLESLEAFALSNNPALRRMQEEAAAAWAKTGYAAKLPDPTISSMFFIPPMNFEPDRQVAELQVMQMIPWLSRLDAEAQRAHVEALAAEQLYRAERLRVLGELRIAWYRLYVLGKQVSTTEADKAQLRSLIESAGARIATGDAQPGDVLMATLELSNLEEQQIGYRQQIVATSAEINRLIGRDARVPVGTPLALQAELPSWNHDLLREVAFQMQPELEAARLQTAATRWGIEVARLRRRPELTVSGGWMPMDAPGMVMPGAGADSWTLGVSASIPIWHRQYDAMVTEASRQHFAAHASEDEVAQRIDALLRDLWEQAVASRKTVELYEQSILPQARQTYEANLQSLANNTVPFERVIRDYRTLLNLELGYHRALGQLATTVARIRQTVGVDLLEVPQPPGP
jgi:cobalt-zinc-cadmium efflux system outer membrane protein